MGESSIPAVGIDLGTTYSVIAHLDAQGRPRTIQNAEGDITTPSVLLFDRSGVVVGKEAVKAAAEEPDSVAEFAKRDMGNSVYSKPIHGQYLPPEVVQSFLLRKLRDDAQMVLGQEVTKVVITVPAYFNEPRRKSTQDAALLAGLDAIDIINEPTAAAIAYGVQQGFLTGQGTSKTKEKVLVYDLGGGTFDVTLMEIEGANYVTLATAGDVYLGGIDWDRRIADWIAQEFSDKYGGDDLREDPAIMHRLMHEGEDSKRALSARSEVTIKFEHHGQSVRLPLTRAHFEQLTADLLERTRFTIRNLLKDAKTEWSDVTRLLLTGGSTRMPMIQDMLKKESGLPVDRSLSADEAVAHGAAIYAGFLLAQEGQQGAPLAVGKVTNVNSHHLGVLGFEQSTGRPRCQVLIPRNTALPASRSSRFATRRENQRSVVVNVVEGGDASGHHATAIGKCVVADLPPGLPANTPVRVVFSYAQNGLLTVEAEVPGAGRKSRLEIERASGLTPEMLEQWKSAIDAGLKFEEPHDQDEGEFVVSEESVELAIDPSEQSFEVASEEQGEITWSEEPAAAAEQAETWNIEPETVAEPEPEAAPGWDFAAEAEAPAPNAEPSFDFEPPAAPESEEEGEANDPDLDDFFKQFK